MPGLLNLQDPTTAYNKSVSGLPIWDPKYQQLTQKFQTDLGAYQKQQNDLNAAPTPPVKTQTGAPVWNEKYQQWMSPEMMPSSSGASALPQLSTTPVTPQTPPPPVAAPVSTYTPTAAVQNPNTGTVQGQIDAITKKNSPLMQREEQRGLDLANIRGLLNSGMAIQSAQNAVYDAALPIASADAASSNQFTLANAGEVNRAGATNTEAANRSALAQTEAANNLALQTLRGQQSQDLANIEATYKNQIQTSASAANFYASVVQQWTASQTATGTTAAQKDAAAAFYKQALQNGMAIISAAGGESAVDLSSLLNFTGASQ